MTDLVAFLNARYDERAAKARAAMHGGEGRWTQPQSSHLSGRVVDERGETVVYDEGAPTEEQAAHIVENDPARVLAEVEANRRTVELHRPVRKPSTGSGGGTVEDCAMCGHFPAQYPCATLRLRALPFADHPDYDERWRP